MGFVEKAIDTGPTSSKMNNAIDAVSSDVKG